jgi:hypothetical protein
LLNLCSFSLDDDDDTEQSMSNTINSTLSCDQPKSSPMGM